jgi:hypothetical protein
MTMPTKPVILVLVLLPVAVVTWWWTTHDEPSEKLRFGVPLGAKDLDALAPDVRLDRVTRELERRVARAGGQLDVLSTPARNFLLVRRSEPALGFTGFNVPADQSPTLLLDLATAYRELGEPRLAAVVDAAIADGSMHHQLLIKRWTAEWNAEASLRAQSAFIARHGDEIFSGSP